MWWYMEEGEHRCPTGRLRPLTLWTNGKQITSRNRIGDRGGAPAIAAFLGGARTWLVSLCSPAPG
jgi:hypothetical protein